MAGWLNVPINIIVFTGLLCKASQAAPPPTIENLAEHGDEAAENKLGLYYKQIDGLPQNAAKEFYWFQKAASQGFAEAQDNLGDDYSVGSGVVKDQAKAFFWYQKAANQGNAYAELNLGLLYEDGEGAAQDLNKSAYWFHKAGVQGNADGDVLFADAYAAGQGVEQSYLNAAYWYQKAADQNDLYADGYLALLYASGRGVTEDDYEAIQLMEKFDGDGDGIVNQAKAEDMIGDGFALDGWSPAIPPKDYALATSWYLRSARDGDADGEFNLGTAYASGLGLQQSDSSAAFWYQKAADQGDLKAWYSLAFAYASGAGVPQDDAKALYYIKKTFENVVISDQLAAKILANGLASGDNGVRQDNNWAGYWLQKAGN